MTACYEQTAKETLYNHSITERREKSKMGKINWYQPEETQKLVGDILLDKHFLERKLEETTASLDFWQKKYYELLKQSKAPDIAEVVQ